MAVIVGPKRGSAHLTGTAGDDTITARGSHNTIVGGGGNDSVNGGSDFANVVFGAAGNGDFTVNDTVSLFGSGDTVTAGDENVFASGNIRLSNLMFGSGNDTVSVDGAYNKLTFEAGADQVTALGGHATIEFGGKSSQDTFGTDNVTVSGLHNYVEENVFAQHGGFASGTLNIVGGSGHGTFGVSGGNGNVTTGGLYNNISGGIGTIVAGSGYDTVEVYSTSSTIVLDGHANDVFAVSSDTSITGGSGNGNFTLDGFGTNTQAENIFTLDSGGLHNHITVSDATIGATVGSGDDTISATASSGTITFAGNGNSLLLSGGADMTVVDNSRGLDIQLENTIPTELTLDHFDHTGLIDFGTLTTFTSVSQVVSDLLETSPGNYSLVVPGQSSTGTIEFNDVGKLTANNFRLG